MTDERRPGGEPVAARVDEQPGDGPERRHQRERAHPSSSLDPARDRKLREHDRERVDEEDRADLTLAQVGLVARERGEEGEERVPGRDEHEVQRPEAEEGLVPEDGRVGGGCVSDLVLRHSGIRHEGEHADVREERDGVEHEQDRERRRIADDGDQARREPAEPDSEVHRHALLREGCVPAGRRSQARDQCRLARPEARAARSLDRDQDERLPRDAHERQEPVADRLQDEPARERGPRADPVDQWDRPGLRR